MDSGRHRHRLRHYQTQRPVGVGRTAIKLKIMYSDNYAVMTLQKTAESLEKALNGWEQDNYPEAHKRQQKALKQVRSAIERIEPTQP